MFQVVFERQLPLDFRSVGEARLALNELTVTPDATLRDDVELVVSELVANAVAHTPTSHDTPLTLRLLADAETLRVEVDDPDPTLPIAQPQVLDAERGRGLHIVKALSRSHGVALRPTGKCVWAELGPRGGDLFPSTSS